MKKTSEIRTSVNADLDQSSLWSIVGQERIIEILQNTSSSYFYNKEIGRDAQYRSVLIHGKPGSGRRTIGRALINAYGADIRECLGRTLGMGGEAFSDYFDPQSNIAFFVRGGENLSRFAQETFYKLLTTNKIYIPDGSTRTRIDVFFETTPLVIFTIENLLGLFPELRQAFDLQLVMAEYSTRELSLILQQRIKYCGWKYESNEVLEMIAQNSQKNPGKSLDVLQFSYDLSRSNNRDVIKKEDAQDAVELLGE